MPPNPRILLDECVPTDLRLEFPHDLIVHTVQFAGFKGLKNGKLLAAARDHYDVILTLDRGFRGQQNIPNSNLALITLAVKEPTLAALRGWIVAVVRAADSLAPGQNVVIGDSMTNAVEDSNA